MPCANRITNTDTSYVRCPVLTNHCGKSTARVLQQLHYWLSHENLSYGIIHDNRQWIRNSYNQWHQQIKKTNQDLAVITIRRAFSDLERQGIVLSHCFDDHKNYMGGNQVKSYTIDYDRLESIVGDLNKTLISRPRSVQEQQSALITQTHNRAGDTDSYKKANYYVNAQNTQSKRAFSYDQMSTPPDQMSTPPNRYISNKHSNKLSLSMASQPSETTYSDNPEEKNKIILFEEMIQVWNEIIEETPNKIRFTPQRSQLLSISFQQFFNSELEQWIVFCRKIASSKFLMGEKENYTWKINFDWLFKFPNSGFPNIQGIFEGKYSFGDRVVPDFSHNMNIKNGDKSVHESPEIGLLRKNLKQTLKEQHYDGHLEYLRWFAKAGIHIEDKNDKSHVILFVKDQYTYDVIRSRFDEIYSNFFNEIHIGVPETSSLDHICSQQNVETSPTPNCMLETKIWDSSEKKSLTHIQDHEKEDKTFFEKRRITNTTIKESAYPLKENCAEEINTFFVNEKFFLNETVKDQQMIDQTSTHDMEHLLLSSNVIQEEVKEQKLRVRESNTKTGVEETGDVDSNSPSIAPVKSYSSALKDLKLVQIRKKIKNLIPDSLYMKWFKHASIVIKEGRAFLHVPAYSIKQQLESQFSDILSTFFEAVHVVSERSQSDAFDVRSENQKTNERVIESLKMTTELISEEGELNDTLKQKNAYKEDQFQINVLQDSSLEPIDKSYVLNEIKSEDGNILRAHINKISCFKEKSRGKNFDMNATNDKSDTHNVNQNHISCEIDISTIMLKPIASNGCHPPSIKKEAIYVNKSERVEQLFMKDFQVRKKRAIKLTKNEDDFQIYKTKYNRLQALLLFEKHYSHRIRDGTGARFGCV